MSEENDGKTTTQVSSESAETVKLPDLYTAMAGICYNSSQKTDENKSLGTSHRDSPVSIKTVEHHLDSNTLDTSHKHTAVSIPDSHHIPNSQSYHVAESTKNQSTTNNHPLPNFSSWDQLSCPSLQNYHHGSQILNPLAAAAAAQYNEYYNLSSRSAGVVSYEDWQYPVYYSNYYDNGNDVTKYCEQKTVDGGFEKSKLTPENLSQDSASDRTCSTPDLVMSVLQMENQIKNEMNPKDRHGHWYSPVSSPDCSPVTPIMAESPAPSTEQDSGFFSEDPSSPIFMSHKQTVTQMEETNQKYYVYVPETAEDWKNYHHINPVPLMCSDMTRKRVNKSAMLSGWKPTPGYPVFSQDVLPRNNAFKQEFDNWQMTKYPQFSMAMAGKGNKSTKSKVNRPTRCVTPIPSTITSERQVQSDKISSSLPPGSTAGEANIVANKVSPQQEIQSAPLKLSLFPVNMMEAHIAASKISNPEVAVPMTAQNKSTKDIVNSFISRKSADQVAQVKPSQSLKRKVFIESEEKMNAKRLRHNEPLNQGGVSVMQRWYDINKENPYPSKQDKEDMARLGGITVTQVKSWFANKRNRTNNTRPKVQKRNVEEKLLELCHQLATDARKSTLDNAFVIQQLSAIIDEHHSVPH